MPVFLWQRRIFTSVGLSPPVSFMVSRLRKLMRYFPDRKNLLIASGAQPGPFSSQRSFLATGTPRPDPTALAILPPCLQDTPALERKSHLKTSHSTGPGCRKIFPIPLTLYKATIKTEQLTVPFTFTQKPSLTTLKERFEERIYNISSFPIK